MNDLSPNLLWENLRVTRRIPHWILEALRSYFIRHEKPTSHFVLAILQNDLKEVFRRADDACMRMLSDIMIYCDGAPGGTWGSPGKVAAWLESDAVAELCARQPF